MELFLFEDSTHRRLPGELSSSVKRCTKKRLVCDHVRNLLYRARLNRFQPYIRRASRTRVETSYANDALKPVLNETTQSLEYLCSTKHARKNGAASDFRVSNANVLKTHSLHYLAGGGNISLLGSPGVQTNNTRLVESLFVDNTLSVYQSGFNHHNQHSVLVKLELDKMKSSRTYPEDSCGLYLRVVDNVDGHLTNEVFIGIGSPSNFSRGNAALGAVDDSCDLIYIHATNMYDLAAAPPEIRYSGSGSPSTTNSPKQLLFFRLFPLTFVGGITLEKRNNWLCEKPIDSVTVTSGALIARCGKDMLAFDIDELLRDHNSDSACCIGDEAQKKHFPGLLGDLSFDQLSHNYHDQTKKPLRLGVWPCGFPTLVRYKTDGDQPRQKFPPVWQFTTNGYAEFCNLTSGCRVPFFITHANKSPYYNLCSLQTDEIIEQFSLIEYGINMPDYTVKLHDMHRNNELLNVLDGHRCCFAVEYPPDASLVVKELSTERNNSFDLKAPAESRALVVSRGFQFTPAPKVQTVYMVRPLMSSLVRDELKRYGFLTGLTAADGGNSQFRSHGTVSSYGRQIRNRMSLMQQGDECSIVHILTDDDTRILAIVYTKHGDKDEKLLSTSWVQLHEFATGRFLSWFPLKRVAKPSDECKDEMFELMMVGDVGAVHRWRASASSKEYNIDYYRLIRQRTTSPHANQEA